MSYNGYMGGLGRLWNRIRKKAGTPRLLCDTCRYDYPSACRNPERPNATVCGDYRKR